MDHYLRLVMSGLNAIAFIVTWLWRQLVDIVIIIKILRLEYEHCLYLYYCLKVAAKWIIIGIVFSTWLTCNLYYHYFAGWMQYMVELTI